MMPRQHSWKWLPSRFAARSSMSRSPHSARPPLPALEPLEDRVLLSAVPPPSGDVNQILIGLLRDQLGVRNSELVLLKQAGALANGNKVLETAFSKIENALVDADAALYKLTEFTIANKQTNTDTEQYFKVTLEDVIITSYDTVNQEVKLFGEDSQLLLPAVQKIRDAADSAVNKLSTLGALKFLPASGFLKIGNDLLSVSKTVQKITIHDLTIPKTIDKSSPVLMAFEGILDHDFLKLRSDLAAFGDGSVFQALGEDLGAYKLNTLDLVSFFDSGLKIDVG